MKIFLLSSLVVLAAARPQESLQDSELLRSESTMNEDGSFTFGFETTDPIQQDVTGQIKQIGEEAVVVMQGSYSFQTPEGQTITINWVANEDGFQPQGDAIPVAPEDPNAAAQAAAYAAAQSDTLVPYPEGTLFLPPPPVGFASPASLV